MVLDWGDVGGVLCGCMFSDMSFFGLVSGGSLDSILVLTQLGWGWGLG